MYLKRLEIQGFKSFADKVEFEFSGGITAIVGPNGSGKSNVVDSIRWVLGEQSAKNLRGSKMDDVIFAGSADRRAVGMAQVVLTLDNSEGLFPLDYDEITIARRLYRSGESEYLINKAPCRLKDIHELFMDTGLGREGFSVISQGKVDEILSLKPEDRRGLIEEAAGIIKYKYRKKEAERKLQDTEENLVRINDIVSELAERIVPLQEQAEKAKRYQLWKGELDDLEISLEVENVAKNVVQEKTLTAKRQENEDALTKATTTHSQLDARLVTDKALLQEADLEIAELQQSYYTVQSQIERQENMIQLATQLKGSLQEQQGKLRGEMQYYQAEVEKLAIEQHEKQETAAVDQASFRQKKQLVEQLAIKIEEKEQQRAELDNQINALKDENIRQMQNQARNHNEILRLEQDLQNTDRRKSKIEERVQRLRSETQTVTQALTEAEISRTQLTTVHEGHQSALERAQQLQAQQKQQAQKMQVALEEDKTSFQQINSRYHALKELEEAGDGYQFGVKSVLEQKKSGQLRGVVGTIAQLVKVPDYLEKAIETVLGAGLQNIVMDNDQNAQVAINYLKEHQKGRATFLPLNTIKGHKAQEQWREASVLGLAVDLVQFDARYEQVMNYLLGRVWVVKDLASAVMLGKQKGFSQRLVTLDGDLITPGGALTGGNYAKQKGSLLGRARQIAELFDSAGQLKEKIGLKNKDLENITQEIDRLQTQVEMAQEQVQDERLQLNEFEQQEEQLLREKNRLGNDLALETLDYTDLSTEASDSATRLTAEKALREDIEGQVTSLAETLSIMKQTVEQLMVRIADETKKYNQHHIELATGEQRCVLLQEQLEQLDERLRGVGQQMVQKQQELSNMQQKDREKDVEILSGRAEVQRLVYESQQKNQTLVVRKDQRAIYQTQIMETEEKIKGIQQVVDQLKDQKYVFELQLSKVKTQIENGLRRLAQNFDCTYDEALSRKMVINDEKEMMKQVTKLKGLIQGLGSINFTAMEDYQQVHERLTFLTTQVDDLMRAKESLDKVIKDMEQLMAQKFRETYQVVNETFSTVFTAMFGGGQARLELSYPQDFLLTGIEIIAQPPGKKEQILSLLSGGERAMTAIALLFALLTVKPSPFCILDEIEAALDDVNVDRFARFIKDYTHKTQFIVISHRKGTMEAADTLYGVAMENNGVSRLMSVRLSDYQA